MPSESLKFASVVNNLSHLSWADRFLADSKPSDASEKFSSALGLLITLLCAVLLTYWRTSLLDDPDTWWHIVVGSDIWSNREFPIRDTYSHTFYGHPWIAKEWLSQIILFFSYSLAGLNGVALVSATSVCLACFISYRYLSRHVRPILAAVVSMAVMFLSSPTFLARPHIFTLPLILMWTYELFQSARDGRSPNYWSLAILVIWANLHASFTLGFVIALFAFLDFVERNRLTDKTALTKWLVFLVLCPICTLIHPYLHQASMVTLEVVHGNEAVPFIAEWQAFSARDHRIHEAALLLILYGLLISKLQLPLARSAFLVVMLHLFLTHVRFAYAFFLLAPVLLSSEAAAQIPAISAGRWKSAARDAIEDFLARFFRPVAALTALASAGLIVFFMTANIKPDRRVYPADAITYAKEHQFSGNVLNSYDFGGPLIFNGIKTFVDGRTDQLFLDGFSITDKETAKPGNEPEFFKVLQRYKIRWTLLKRGDSRIQFLDHNKDWQRVYEDEFAVVHVAGAMHWTLDPGNEN